MDARRFTESADCGGAVSRGRGIALRALARAGLAAVTLALGACGFHLEGAGALPPAMAKTYLSGTDPHSDFLLSLTDALRLRGSQVVSSADVAQAVVDITRDDTGQRVLSVSARNIPREYEVFYAVTFTVRIGGEQLMEPESLIVTRSYTYDETQVLGKASEEEVLQASAGRRSRTARRAPHSGARRDAAATHVTGRNAAQEPAAANSRVTSLGDIEPAAIERLLTAFGLSLAGVAPGASIPGSYWGDSEAGLVGDRLFARADTPVHSLLHELGHYVCMDPTAARCARHRCGRRRRRGSGRVLPAGVARRRACEASAASAASRDMDTWGYSFREGSARAWLAGDGVPRRVLGSRRTASSTRPRVRRGGCARTVPPGRNAIDATAASGSARRRRPLRGRRPSRSR